MSDYAPPLVERERLVPVPAQVIDKAILVAGLLAQRDLVPNGSATGKTLDYSLKRWVALTRYLDDGSAHRQQSSREPDPVMGTRALELGVCRVAAQ